MVVCVELLLSKKSKLLHGPVEDHTLTDYPARYLLHIASMGADVDDDAAEGRGKLIDDRDRQGDTRGQGGQHKGKKEKRSKKDKGQNSERRFGHSSDTIRICNSRAFHSEFSPRECQFGDNCRLSHDLRAYLASGRRADTEKFGGKCPVFEANGRCASGWKCRFVGSHSEEVEREDGRKEMVLHGIAAETGSDDLEETRPGVHNIVPASVKVGMGRKRIVFDRSEEYVGWLHGQARAVDAMYHNRTGEDTEEQRAAFVDPPFLPSEKRRLYFGPETPALAPLTTQGNLPFRRLCVDMGAQLTYSEMAMGLPLLQGAKADWTLMKCHDSEIVPPAFSPRNPALVANGYDNSKDFRFGAQISGHHPWIATKAAEALATYCPKLRLIDLNCGCPIDMVYKAGGGSALLDNHGKLERMIRGMNAVSGEIPITAKIRTGVKTTRPTAPTVLNKLAFGGKEYRDRFGAPGCAAVTLHGRSREMRYTKTADWSYIAECAALVKSYNEERDRLTDTASEPDPSTLPNSKDGRMYFLGNGDCYSHEDYYAHLAPETSIDAVMIGRGALVKPWLFEEITAGQYLDKSSTERLTYVEKFVRYGLDAWGSDEVGLGLTRRFLLEWLSFASRYIPVGLLEHLPPSLNDRPPAYKGRDELETLMASGNYKDWIKIRCVTSNFRGNAPNDWLTYV
jgi:tRNA-dihydrouridine synthase 3